MGINNEIRKCFYRIYCVFSSVTTQECENVTKENKHLRRGTFKLYKLNDFKQSKLHHVSFLVSFYFGGAGEGLSTVGNGMDDDIIGGRWDT
jgi:hypothetical protein